MYFILYNENWYTKNFHNCKEIEHKIDAFLSYLTYICYLYDNKIISKKEFEVLKYEINSICYANRTQNYLWRHYHLSIKKYKSNAFSNLITYLKNSILENEKKEIFENVIPIPASEIDVIPNF